MTPPLVELIKSGAVTNRYKTINKFKNVYTLALGDEAMYEFLNDNSSMELYPVNYVNNPEVIGRNDNVISINAFLQVGLDGEVNSEVAAGRQYSAPGGQLDFVRGAQRSQRRQIDPDRVLNRGAWNRLAHRAADRRTRDRPALGSRVHRDRIRRSQSARPVDPRTRRGAHWTGASEVPRGA